MNAVNIPNEIALKLLDEFVKEPIVSQRALAGRLGIALGLVNSYIKRLYNKGHIKIKTLPRNRIKYIITPQGFAEKARLTFDYMNHSIRYFRDVRANIERTYSSMMSEDVARILLWGDGEIAELCYISTRGLPLEIVGIIADNKIDNGFFGHHIYTSDDISRLNFDAILVSSIDKKVLANVQEFESAVTRVFYLY
jgi:DNA-binding MarR family transcriptional regulator